MNETENKSYKNECNDIGKNWKRNCPKCGNELCYINKKSFQNSVRNNKLCKSCVQIGHTISEYTKQKIRNKISGKNHPHYGKLGVNFGRKFTEKHKLKISISQKGIPWTVGFREKQKNIRSSKEYREKCRISAIKRMVNQNLNGNILARSYNPNACKYFDELNKQNGWNLQHALNGGEVCCSGYFLDAYDKEKNIIVEYDESRHYKYKNSQWVLSNDDVIRMDELKTKLVCKFFRYNEKLKELKEY